MDAFVWIFWVLFLYFISGAFTAEDVVRKKALKDKINRCCDCNWVYWPNNYLVSTTRPFCQGAGKRPALVPDNYYKKKPDDCPLIGKEERY